MATIHGYQHERGRENTVGMEDPVESLPFGFIHRTPSGLLLISPPLTEQAAWEAPWELNFKSKAFASILCSFHSSISHLIDWSDDHFSFSAFSKENQRNVTMATGMAMLILES